MPYKLKLFSKPWGKHQRQPPYVTLTRWDPPDTGRARVSLSIPMLPYLGCPSNSRNGVVSMVPSTLAITKSPVERSQGFTGGGEKCCYVFLVKNCTRERFRKIVCRMPRWFLVRVYFLSGMHVCRVKRIAHKTSGEQQRTFVGIYYRTPEIKPIFGEPDISSSRTVSNRLLSVDMAFRYLCTRWPTLTPKGPEKGRCWRTAQVLTIPF